MTKAFLRTVYQHLQGYSKKALGKGAFYDKATDLCCVVGTVPQIRHYATGGYPAIGGSEFEELCKSLGGTWMDARDLGLVNDAFNGTPEERYRYMMTYVQARL